MSGLSCLPFNLLNLSNPYSLERDLFMTNHCINTTVLLAEYLVAITVFSSFILVHLYLLIRKLTKMPKFRKQLGFFLVLVELGVAISYLIGYSLLLTSTNIFLFDVFFGLGWQLAMLFVDCLVYFM